MRTRKAPPAYVKYLPRPERFTPLGQSYTTPEIREKFKRGRETIQMAETLYLSNPEEAEAARAAWREIKAKMRERKARTGESMGEIVLRALQMAVAEGWI